MNQNPPDGFTQEDVDALAKFLRDLNEGPPGRVLEIHLSSKTRDED